MSVAGEDIDYFEITPTIDQGTGQVNGYDLAAVKLGDLGDTSTLVVHFTLSFQNSSILVPGAFTHFYQSAAENITPGKPVMFVDPNDGIHGDEIWVSDGTVAGTFMLKDINLGSASSNATEFTFLNSELYFVADDGMHGQQLWESDGTTADTVMLTNVNGTNFHPVDMTVAGNKMYFFASDGTHGQELWASDGTVSGTAMVADLNAGAGSTFTTGFAGSNGKFYFEAFAPGKGDELYVSDGTQAGTLVVDDIRPGTFGSEPTELTDVNGTLYFVANDGTNGDQIWKTDGTAGNTAMVTAAGHFADNFSFLYNFNGKLVFDAPLLAAGIHGQQELYITNGTDAGTTALTSVSAGVFQPQGFFTVGNLLYFTANDGTHGNELWVSDGTPGGTQMLADINPSGSSSPGGFANVNGTLFFNAFDGTSHGDWVSDGTVAGTQKLYDTAGVTTITPFTFAAPETVQTLSGIDLRWATLYDEMANSPIGAGGTATQYTCVDSGAFNGHTAAIKFIVTGTGFTYSGNFPNIQLTGGTITGMQETDSSNTVLATITGLAIAATDFNTAMASYVAGGASPNPAALNALFLAQNYQATGGAGSDKLQGGNLNDTFIGSAGNDTINGGTGSNTADYSGLTTPGLFAIVQGGNGTVNKGGANGTDTLTKGQYLTDTGTGRSNGDVFEIDAAEHVTASSANFNYLIELSASVNLAYGINFTGITEFVSNVGTNVVNFSNDPNFAYVFGSTGNDTLTLGSGGGYLIGEGGANVLTGGANATNLFIGGQGGTDTMNGGGGTGTAANYYFVDGNDQVNGAGAFNAMIELVSNVIVQIGSAQYQHVQEFVSNSGTNAVTVAGTDSDFVYLYGGTGNDTLSTGSGGGYLIGEGGTNVLNGGGGLNVFVADGGAGIDTMNGGSGSNVYLIDANSIVHGNGTFNTVEELQQSVSLVLGSAQLGTNVQQVVLNSGTNTADFHTATAAVFLYGGAGNDTLFGGSGNDFLYGGTGTNIFTFANGWGKDTIEDWAAGTNSQIDLTALSTLGVHAISDLTQTITAGNDVITSSHTGTNSITLLGVGSALAASSFHFA